MGNNEIQLSRYHFIAWSHPQRMRSNCFFLLRDAILRSVTLSRREVIQFRCSLNVFIPTWM